MNERFSFSSNIFWLRQGIPWSPWCGTVEVGLRGELNVQVQCGTAALQHKKKYWRVRKYLFTVYCMPVLDAYMNEFPPQVKTSLRTGKSVQDDKIWAVRRWYKKVALKADITTKYRWTDEVSISQRQLLKCISCQNRNLCRSVVAFKGPIWKI